MWLHNWLGVRDHGLKNTPKHVVAGAVAVALKRLLQLLQSLVPLLRLHALCL